MRREAFKFWALVRLMLDNLWYVMEFLPLNAQKTTAICHMKAQCCLRSQWCFSQRNWLIFCCGIVIKLVVLLVSRQLYWSTFTYPPSNKLSMIWDIYKYHIGFTRLFSSKDIKPSTISTYIFLGHYAIKTCQEPRHLKLTNHRTLYFNRIKPGWSAALHQYNLTMMN